MRTLVVAVGVMLARDAHAYRPFDGTDADVAEPGEFELELGTAYERDPEASYLVAPAMVLNWGFATHLELVADIKGVVGLAPAAGEPRTHLLDNDLLIKWLGRDGTLQDRRGPSLAIEAGVLLPEARGDDGFGAEANLIGSYRTRPVTLHLNQAIAYTRSHSAELVTSAILEGPASLAVRPVAEATLAYEAGDTTLGGLVGAIWTASEHVAIDGGVRLARDPAATTFEARVGMTWTL
ncbi:MAG TPA: hypothetical protein VFQ53_19460 [Kofleriaceae bacterium]|nr:hypothetical protein [Kofleriaceae bacterium]